MASLTSIANQALKAFNASNYIDAITLYTKALALAPNSPDYYLKRSTSYQRSNPPRYDLALRDAEYAVILADRRGKRELIGSSQLRRGIALYQLKRYGDAKFCFDEAAKRVPEKEKNTLAVWEKKVEMAVEKLGEDDVAREVTVAELPDVVVPEHPEGADEDKKSEKDGNEGHETTPRDQAKPSATKAVPPPSAPASGVTVPASKIRHEWYQTNTQVVVTVYAKGVPEKDAAIEIAEKMISISFPVASGSSYDLTVDPLFDRIDTSQSKSKVYGTKIELTLTKATPGRKWAGLEGAEDESQLPTATTAATNAVPSTSAKPLYPTSSKSGPKDWDKLAKELAAKPKKEDGQPAEEDYESEDGGDPVNGFFKKLYKDADEDTRRAMMKSYVESNGTALSTNWSEVGKGKVETSPPDGMEAKGWNA